MTTRDYVIAFFSVWMLFGIGTFLFTLVDLIAKDGGERDKKDPIIITVLFVIFMFVVCEVFGLIGFGIYETTHKRRRY